MRPRDLFLAFAAIAFLFAPATLDAQWISDGRPLCTASLAQTNPSLVRDGAGGAFVFWRDVRNEGISGADIYGIGVTRAGGFLIQWPIDGVPLCTAPTDQVNPTAAPDGFGGAVVVWIDNRNETFGDLYASKLGYDGHVPPSWPTNGLPVCTAARTPNDYVVAADGAGGVFVAWNDLRNLSHNDLYVHHILAGGTVDPSWPTDGLAICAAAGNQSSAAIAPDGSGGAIVAWKDDRNFATTNIDI
jgi:hypothetical protein